MPLGSDWQVSFENLCNKGGYLRTNAIFIQHKVVHNLHKPIVEVFKLVSRRFESKLVHNCFVYNSTSPNAHILDDVLLHGVKPFVVGLFISYRSFGCLFKLNRLECSTHHHLLFLIFFVNESYIHYISELSRELGYLSILLDHFEP